MPTSYVDFKPAQVSQGKCFFVYYYVVNPFTNQMERVRMKLNHIAKSERKRYAQRLVHELNIKLYNGYNPFLEKSDTKCITLIEAVELFMQYAQKNTRPDTVRSYNSYCTYLTNFLKNNNFNTLFVFHFKNEHAKKIVQGIEHLKNTTYNNYIKFYRTLWNWLISRKYTKDNPFTDMKVKRKEQKLRDIIPVEIRNEIKKHLLDVGFESFYFFCQFTYKLLIRPAETFRLKIGDINFDNRLILLRADDAKDHDNRTYAIPAEFLDYLLKFKDLPKNLYIFSEDYKPGTILKDSRYSGKTWDSLRKKLGFAEKYTFYSLKDTGITELLDSGVPAKIVQQLAGHSSIEMTEKYAHKLRANEILQYNNLKF